MVHDSQVEDDMPVKRDGRALRPSGFMLLPPSPVRGYRGVDRNPFEPLLLDNEMDPLAPVQEGELHIWAFYSPGWRQDAYRIFEENSVPGDYDLALVSNMRAAVAIQKIVERHVGPHEIVRCEIRSVENVKELNHPPNSTLLGYDVAYPGGDYYSAVHGLLVNPHPILVAEYGTFLNRSYLFGSTEPVSAYVRRFRQLVPSESASEFVVFRLDSPE